MPKSYNYPLCKFFVDSLFNIQQPIGQCNAQYILQNLPVQSQNLLKFIVEAFFIYVLIGLCLFILMQFVPFRDFESTDNIVLSQARLAKEVLAEIPDQFLSYMKANNIRPKPVRSDSIRSNATAPPM